MLWVERAEQRFKVRWWRWPRWSRQLRAVAARYVANMSAELAPLDTPAADVTSMNMARWTPARPALRAGTGAHLRYASLAPDRKPLRFEAAVNFGGPWNDAEDTQMGTREL